MKKFPTIKQMESAVLFWMADNYGKCEYQQASHTFLAIEMVQTPHYDSGGGIDAIDFKPIEHIISFIDAYKMWVDMEYHLNEINKAWAEYDAPKPVAPKVIDDIELPF